MDGSSQRGVAGRACGRESERADARKDSRRFGRERSNRDQKRPSGDDGGNENGTHDCGGGESPPSSGNVSTPRSEPGLGAAAARSANSHRDPASSKGFRRRDSNRTSA